MDITMFIKMLSDVIPQNSKIHISPEIPHKKLFNALGSYQIDINPKDVLLLIDDTTFGSATEGLILTNDRFYIHPTSKRNITIELESINTISCKKNKLYIDEELVFEPSSPDSVDIARFYTALIIFMKYITGKISSTPDDIDTLQSERERDGRKIVNISKAISIKRSATLTESLSSSFMDILSKTGSYTPIILVLFKYYTPDKVFAIISNLPVVGVAGFLGKLVLAPPLEKLHRVFMEFGEQYIMEKVAANWHLQQIEINRIEDTIQKIPSMIINDKEKNEAIELVRKYYNDDLQKQEGIGNLQI